MTDNTALALLCLLEGDGLLFRVKPLLRYQVTDLKKLVYEKHKSTLKCEAADLVLFKLQGVPSREGKGRTSSRFVLPRALTGLYSPQHYHKYRQDVSQSPTSQGG
jgi:hypothetical protein